MAEVTGVNLDWTMGAMLFEAANLPPVNGPKKPLFQTPIGVGLVVLSGLLLALALGIFLFFRSARSKSAEAQRLLDSSL